jgi:hypothetical protein
VAREAPRRGVVFLCLAIVFITTLARAGHAADKDRAPAEPPPVAPERARGWQKPPGKSPAEVALFLPRLLLLLPNLALNVTFLPVRQGLRVVSRNVVSSDDDPTNDQRAPALTFLPHFAYLTDFGATVGGAARLQHLAGHDEEAMLAAAYGGPYAPLVELSVLADRTAGSRAWLESRTRYEHRPREVFSGIGDSAGRPSTPQTRFTQKSLTLLERAGVSLGQSGGLLKLGGTTLLERSSFGSKSDGAAGDPSIETAYETESLPGFAHGFTTLELQANVVVDTRDARAATCRGLYAVGFLGGVPSFSGYELGHAGLDVSAYIDLYKSTRVLVLRTAVEAVFGEDDEIPFTRLPRLGGPERLRGYVPGAYRDREAALVSAEYRYPIHSVVAGALFVDTGRVAPEPSELVDLSRWHVGGGVGLRVRTSAATIAALDLALGSGVQLLLSIFPFDSPAPGARE